VFQPLTRESKSQKFFNLPLSEKAKLVPTPQPFGQGYVGIEEEKIRGQAAMKENFDFGGPETHITSSWPREEQLPGFRDFAADFHQVGNLSGAVMVFLRE
jgi:isopenicillin N synthase-like dioxygenase